MNSILLKLISLILLLSLFNVVSSDKKKSKPNTPIKETPVDKDKVLKLNEAVTGQMKENDSFEYYTLVLPNTIKGKEMLIFSIKESRKGVKEGEEIFSDPDIYISKSLKYPKNGEDADWYSERYGSDIVSIPSYAVAKGEKFYITMYCQYKCRYQLKAYLSKEIEITDGNIYTVNIDKKSSMNYFLSIPKDQPFSELNLISYSPDGKPYKVFMAKDSPSSQNTFKVEPSWMGGYLINVNKNSKQYCTSCVYHILFQAQDEDVKVQFYVNFPETITKVIPGSPLTDIIERNAKRCYSFDMSKKRDEEILIQTNLFSGSTLLYISGFNENDTNQNITDVKNGNSVYVIDSESTILLTNEDFVRFKNNFHKNRVDYSESLYFCIYGLQKSSYTLNVYFLNEASNIQEYNYVFPGTEITGYIHGGEVTSYSIVNSNNELNANVTFSLKQIRGEPQLYGAFCDTLYCRIYNHLLKKKKENNEILFAEFTSFTSSTIKIQQKNNKCYNYKGKYCKILAYVECPGNKEDICSFKLSAGFENAPIHMSPKKTYFNHIPKGKSDLYEIIINEPTVNSAVIVLTSVTGDAQLLVSKKFDENTLDKQNKTFILNRGDSIIGLSANSEYLPDVVRIKPEKVKGKNIVGKYTVKVFSKECSSYNIYYYTTRNKTQQIQPVLSDINVALKDGLIIKDYFPNNIEYKIYSYTPDDITKKDIKIILTRINVRLTFKVYLDFNNIKFKDTVGSIYDERLVGYDWVSDSNNELTISKDDKKYSEKGPYYIVVIKDRTTDIEKEISENYNDLDKKALIMYYIGVTKEGKSFVLNEGVEHSVTLSKKYFNQTYLYNHNNLNEPFQLVTNILSGEVDVFLDTKIITEKDINEYYKSAELLSTLSKESNITKNLNQSQVIYPNSGNSLRARLGINDYGSLTLLRDYFERYCPSIPFTSPSQNMENAGDNTKIYFERSCPLFICVKQSPTSLKFEKESQYLITAKSSITSGIFLQSGKVYKGQMNVNQEDHYIIEEVKHREGTTINVKFHSGYGEVYVRVPESPEISKNITFPSEEIFDYKGENCYGGKVVIIPASVFDRINENSLKVQILISVVPSKFYRQSDYNVQYTISYSSEAKRINQNIPYSSYINSGEYQYYTFYFGKNTQNIHISLSNMNGDADLYINYGNEIFPTPSDHDWFSNSMGHEYIEISKNDPYFTKHQLEDASGYYTLLVLGYVNTTYTLFVSSHDENIVKIVDNSPSSCRCEKKNDKCFYRFDNVFGNNRHTARNQVDEIKSTELIFTTQYIYGNGKMYASIYKDHEIYGDMQRKKYFQYFPTEKRYDYSNSERGKRNYLKVIVPETKYSKDTLVLMTFICEEKTDVEIVASSLSDNVIHSYITQDRENIFYLKYNESLSESKQLDRILYFYSFKDADIIYEFHAYLGKAKILVYTNETKYNYTTKQSTYEYNHISDFVLQSQNDIDLNDYKYPKTFTEDYINSIPKYMSKGKTLYFKVKPLSNFGFYLQVLHDRSWVNIPIGKEKTYLIKNQTMSGYFDIYDEFSSVEMSVNLEDYTKKKLKIYIKLLVINKNSQDISSNNIENKLYHYEIPNENNNDYKDETDSSLGSINININNIPIIKDGDKEKKIVRAIFTMDISKIYSYDYSATIVSTNNNHGSRRPPTPSVILSESTVHILITPGVNNVKRIETIPLSYYFSNTSLLPPQPKFINGEELKVAVDGNKEVKIYSLDKIKDTDSKMIVQINSCRGEYIVKFSSKIVDYDTSVDDIKFKILSSRRGRSIYLIENLKYKHIYLSIKPDQKTTCTQDRLICPKELSYLLHYYSTDVPQINPEDVLLKLRYRKGGGNRLWIKVPTIFELSHRKVLHNVKEDIEYNLFWTKNTSYYHQMESICYLSQILNRPDIKDENTDIDDNSTIHVLKNIKLNEKNEFLLYDIEADRKIFINILARNVKTNQLTAFIPVRGIANKSQWITVAYIIVIGGVLSLFLIIVISYCKKNKNPYIEESTKLRRSEIEMQGNYYREGVQYSNVAKDNY